MAIQPNLVRLLESLRRAWPGGRTVGDLARELDVQPWRVAELIGRCEPLGIMLDQSGPAVRLDPATLPLKAELIELGGEGRRIGRSVIVFASASSTNDIAWQAADRRESDGLVVVAETQTAGRGRQGRAWLDQPGANLLFSVLLLDRPREEGLANRLVMAASVAIAEAIGDRLGLQPAIRWPNDLYLNGRKFAGILLESRQPPAAASPAAKAGRPGVDVVLGVGVNCNWPTDGLPDLIRYSATSLSAELSGPVDRTDLLRAMLSRLEHWLVGGLDENGEERRGQSPFSQTAKKKGTVPFSAGDDSAAGLDRLHREYLARLDPQARRVRLHYDRQIIEGTVRDVDPLVGLMVQLSGGGIAHFQPAQVSVEWLG